MMSKELIKINKPKTLTRSISQILVNKPQDNYKSPEKNSSILRNASYNLLFNGNDLSKFYNKNDIIFNNKILSRNKNQPFINSKFNLSPFNMKPNRSLKNFGRSSSICNESKNESTFRKKYINKDVISEINYLPKVRPRKIIINYYAGFNELHVQNINQKHNSSTYKKYGHNGPFMGGKYNPENYFQQPKNRVCTNYYGALFQN